MRSFILAIPSIVIALAVAPAYGGLIGDVTFSLDSYSGTGDIPNIPPDADTCLPPGCVLFTGTLTNTDNDPSDSYPMIFTGIGVTFTFGPANSFLSVDNTFYEDVFALSTDPNYNTDNLGNPPDTYYGPVFGIDIAPNATPGVYNGTVTISGVGGLDDEGYNGFTVSADITVDVLAPEPGAASLLFAGLLPLAVWFGVRRQWRFSEASR